jgi:hypothetical protein
LVATPLHFQLHTLDRVELVGDTFKVSTIVGGTGGSKNVGKMSVGDAGPEGYNSYVMANMHMKEMGLAEEKSFQVML